MTDVFQCRWCWYTRPRNFRSFRSVEDLEEHVEDAHPPEWRAAIEVQLRDRRLPRQGAQAA